MEKGETIGEAFVKRYNHVLFVRVNVFEAIDANAQTEEAGRRAEPTSARPPGRQPDRVWASGLAAQ